MAIPVAVDRGFTYSVPTEWEVPPAAGARVLVSFGTRLLVGVVRPGLPPDDPTMALKPLVAMLDGGRPSLTESITALCEWMSDYYVAPIGEVYRLALPGLLTNVDARLAMLTERGEQLASGAALASPDDAPSPRESRVLQRIAAAGPAGISVAELAKTKPKLPGLFASLTKLEAQRWLRLEYEDIEPSTRMEQFVRRTDRLRGDESALQRVVGRSKQRRALLDELESRVEDDGWVALAELRGPFPRAKQLVEVLVEQELVAVCQRPRELDPFSATSPTLTSSQSPTTEQATALVELVAMLDRRRFASALLHGVTGSGKTEVYLQFIAEATRRGLSAIVLVPEIALTPQLADRFRSRFGGQVAVLHSGLTPRQRLDAWHQIRTGERTIVIGARSAVFAPVPNLGVIVVDEEHDPSFKQEDGVRYNARDIALVRAKSDGAVVVLGSATPSLETYALARSGRHTWLSMTTRPTPRPLPHVELVPLSVHRPHAESLLTGVLRQAILDTVAAGEQAIVFLNRRGYTTTLMCEACGSFQQCPDCSAPSMTYHLARNRLMCHLCGHIEATRERCGACGEAALVHGGTGTERVEVAMMRELEGVRVLRLDRDTARGRRLLTTLDRFRRHEADVLVGTQMLAKGHDFPNVTLVGILQGDHGLGLPDPRAAERTFQLLTQVAGRAGRGSSAGRVLIQAYAVNHPAITCAAHHDFSGFAERELVTRARVGNPPHGYLALVRVMGIDSDRVVARAEALAKFLRVGVAKLEGGGEVSPVELLGPVESPIAKINRRIRWQMLLRARDRAALRWVLQHLRPRLGTDGRGATQTMALVDVDPQTLL